LLAHYKLGADARALAVLALASCLFTAFVEAGFLWGRRGYDVAGTLANNFNPAMLEIGVPAPWQVLAFGLVFALAALAVAAGRQTQSRRVGNAPAL
jgi:hypothetical protein